MLTEIKELTDEAGKIPAWNAIRAFPPIIGAALTIGWKTKSAQFLVLQSLALTMHNNKMLDCRK